MRSGGSSGAVAGWLEGHDLSASELSLLFDAALDAIVVIDTDSRVISWNRSAEQTFGWTREEALGRDLGSLVIPERLRPAHTSGMQRYLATGEGPVLNQRIEVQALHRNGHEFPVELTIVPVGAAAGLRFCAFLRDITERKRSERRLAQRALEAEVVYEVASTLSQGGSVEDSFLICEQKICEISGWSVGHCYRPDDPDSPQRLLSTGIWHFADPSLTPIREIAEQFRFRPGEGLPGEIWQSGKPGWIIDIGNYPNFLRRQLNSEFGVRSAFGFPVRAENRLAAVLEFFSTETREPDPELILTVRSISEQIGRVLERQQAMDRQSVLLRELTHRIGNTLAIIGAIFRRLAASSTTKDELGRRFEERLMALAAGHKLLSENDWRATLLTDLIVEAMAPYAGDDSYTIKGPPVKLSPRLTMTLAMVMHELATNAAKYGALSVPEGMVTVRWKLTEDCPPRLVLDWSESGGPPVAHPRERGFGSELIRLMLLQNRGAESAIELAPDGLQASFSMPLPELPPSFVAEAGPPG